MKLIEKILVPINTEDSILPQVTAAKFIADKFNSEILFLAVLPPEANQERISSMVLKYTTHVLDGIIEKLDKKHKVQKIIQYGNAFEQILEHAEKHSVNAIVVNAKEGEYASGSKLGLTAEKLIRKSTKPVWVVDEHTKPPKTIVCPVDFSESSARALENAFKIARTFDAEIHVINVFEPIGEVLSARLETDFHEENAQRQRANAEEFAQFVNKFKVIDVKYYTEILVGDPHSQIVEYTKNVNADLLLLGTTGKNYIYRLLIGSVSERISRELPCSIITTKSENILNLKIEASITNIEKLINEAKNLESSGYHKEAIEVYLKCLVINDVHLPVISAIAKLYEKLGDEDNANQYKQKFSLIIRRIWDKQIEFELRKHFKI